MLRVPTSRCPLSRYPQGAAARLSSTSVCYIFYRLGLDSTEVTQHFRAGNSKTTAIFAAGVTSAFATMAQALRDAMFCVFRGPLLL